MSLYVARERSYAHQLLIGLVVTALLVCVYCGCSSLWQSIKGTAAPAAGGAGGAALGSLAGPAGVIAGAAVGAAVGDSLEENASLRSGETVGDEALEKLWLRGAASAPVESTPFYLRWQVWLIGYFVIRNTNHLLAWREADGFVGRLLALLRGVFHGALGPVVKSPEKKLAEEA